MNKLLSKLMKIFSKIIFGIILLFLLFYFSLWIYVCNFVPKELKTIYNQNIESYLTNEQYNIILFSLNRNKSHRFKWYPFILDFIFEINFKNNHNYIASLASSTIAEKYFSDDNNRVKYTTMDWHIMNYGLMRYIIIKNDHKKCINIIFKNSYMGENIYGIENASEHYYHKNISDISNEELVSLIVLTYNPTRYKINSEENKYRTLKILNEY
jgi:hypothetical protein